MRRLLLEEPVTRAGMYARSVAVFSVIVSAVGVVLIRHPDAETGPAIAVLVSGLLLSVLALLLAAFACVRVWRDGARGVGAAFVGVAISIMLLAYPAYAGLRGLRLPAINDVSTDTEQPPAFSRSSVAFAARGGEYPPEPAPAMREAQREAYSQIAPLTLDIEPEQAFDLARKAAINRKWQIVEAIRPGGRMGNGRIEAIAHSRLLNLPADLTVRIKPRADGVRIDVRSATRNNTRDFGANAEHVRDYLDEVANLAIAIK